MLTEKEIREIINETLYEYGLISKEIYHKCKPHIQTLPYDNRTTDPNKLEKRENKIQERITEAENNIKTLQKENDAFEKDIKKLTDQIDENEETLGNQQYEIDMLLRTNSEILDDGITDVTRREGTPQDTRNVWGDHNLLKEYDTLTDGMYKLQQDHEQLNHDIEQTYMYEYTPLKQFNTNINTIVKDTEKLQKLVDKLNNLDGEAKWLATDARYPLQNTIDNIKTIQERITDYDDLFPLTQNMYKTRTQLQTEVNKNNIQIGKIEQQIKDYKEELKKIN